MRKATAAALAFGLLLAGGAALRADEGGGGGGAPGWKGRGPMADLTAEQRAAMRQAWRAHRDAVTPIKDKLEDELERLRGLVEKAAPEKELAASVDKVKELHKAIRSEREKLMDKMAAQLTPLQRAKGVLAMERRAKRGMAHFFGRGGPKGHPGMRGGRGKGGGGPGWRDALEDDGPESDDDDEEGPEHP